jgi:hypothetical protein
VKEFGELAAVLRVFTNTELEILTEGLVELGKVVLVLGNLTEKFHAFLDNVLAYDFEDLILLECLARNVERQIFRVDDTLDEVQIFRNQILAVHDENAADVKLDVVALLLRLEEIERRTIVHVRKHEHPQKKNSYHLGTNRIALNSS